jgi:splicing factor 45
MSQAIAPPVPPPPPPPPPPTTNPPPPPPPELVSGTISRAPIRYSKPEPEPEPEPELVKAEEDKDYEPTPAPGLGATSIKDELDQEEEEGADSKPRSNRPGQAGFAQRLMSKYGWTKGSGLGAEESGILDPLRVQAEKRRRKADADGGGWAEPGGKGRITGGKRKDGGESRFGSMSEVIVLRGMLEGMENLRDEIADGLGQEIGEECGEKVSDMTLSWLRDAGYFGQWSGWRANMWHSMGVLSGCISIPTTARSSSSLPTRCLRCGYVFPFLLFQEY